MRIRLGLAVVALATTAATFAFAQEEVIKLRQKVMDVNGQAAGVAVGMIRGQIPFDPVVAAAVARSIASDNEIFPDLFPAGSDKSEGETTTKAAPAIWENMADFKAISVKMVADATAAAKAAAQGKDAFAAAFNAVGQNCGACHSKFRLK
ncbi:MAG TPA: cytochrome c [Bauldia sp.]|nr:cytochrome c [Bauldia sp.]